MTMISFRAKKVMQSKSINEILTTKLAVPPCTQMECCYISGRTNGGHLCGGGEGSMINVCGGS